MPSEKKREYNRSYYLANREHALIAASVYRKNNPEKIKESNKKQAEKNKEKRRINGKKYYLENREIILQKRRKYVAENPEKIKELGHRSYIKNRERCLAYSKDWFIKNKEKSKETKRIYHKNHMPEHRANFHKRKARKIAAPGKWTKKDLKIVSSILGEYCLGCGWPVTQIDHVIPLSVGGTNHPTNLQPLCRRCNCSKGARRSTDYRTKKQIKQIMEAFQLELFK